MSLDDPSLLSAYLDGSLTAAQRESMDAALRDDPELLSELRSLTGLQARLGRLARPAAPSDSTDLVVGRLQEWARREPRGLARVPRHLRPWLVLGPLSAAAAALLVSWAALTYDAASNGLSAPGQVGPRPGAAANSLAARAPETGTPLENETADPIRLTPVMPGVAGVDPVSDALRAAHDLRFPNPNDSIVAGTLTITAEPLSLDLLERIDGVIQRSPRIAPHHVLFEPTSRAPKADREALTRLIYAIPLDRNEFERLEESLREALRGRHATVAEGGPKAPRLSELVAASRVSFGQVEPSGLIVPLAPTLVGDRTRIPNEFDPLPAIPGGSTRPSRMIFNDLMLGSALTPGDQHADRQALRELLGLDDGQAHTPLRNANTIYLIRIVER